jgi:LysM repeat protein
VSNDAISRSDLPPPSDGVASNAPLPGSSTLPPGDYVWSPDGVKPTGSVATASYTPPPSAPMTETAAAGGVHVVASGETLYAIGRLYGARPADIAALNGLAAPKSIRVGQRLQIPAASDNAARGRQDRAAHHPRRPADAVHPGRRQVEHASGRARVDHRRGRRHGRARLGRRHLFPLAGARPHHRRLRRQAERREE